MKPRSNILNSGKSKFNRPMSRKCITACSNPTKRPSSRKALDCLPKTFNYFLALVSAFFVVSADIFEVSADILLIVSGAIVVVSGVTVVLSLVLELSLLLLQAAKEAAMIAIAKNFFIFEN
jgi:hypothetical protein